jgi:thymidylate synthase (FAD)
MRIIKPKASIIFDMEIDPNRKIEYIGRVCYNSEDKITADSHVKFISSLIDKKHYSVTEHHVFVLEVSQQLYYEIKELNPKFLNMTFSCTIDDRHDELYLISGSTRGFVDLYKKSSNIFLQIILSFLSKRYPTLYGGKDIYGDITSIQKALVKKELSFEDIQNLEPRIRNLHKYISAKVICDRAIANEIVRHRTFSFSQASTRYINYGKQKGITIIDSPFYTKGLKRFIWLYANKVSEISYLTLIKFFKSTPQEARSVLTNSLKTELVMTNNIQGWNEFFILRDHKDAHPQIIEIAHELHLEFLRLGYLKY